MNHEPNDDNTTTQPTVETQPPAEPQATDAQAEAQTETDPATEVEPPPQQSYVDPRELRIQMLERMLAERDATLHTYIRAHKKSEAEFEAFRQRLTRDKDKEVETAVGKLVEKLLDVDENLERTVVAAEAQRGAPASAGAVEGLVSGVRLVHRLFLERLGELGLVRVDPIGQAFDPTSMEALGIVPVDDPAKDGKVAVTMRAGFRLGARELRPALVQIGKVLS